MKTDEQKLKWNAYMREYNKKNYNPSKEKNRQLENYLKKCDGYFYVYYLPEEHYVGMTNNLYHRMRTHRLQGRHVKDVEILARFIRQVDAHLFETKLHSMDYNGFFVANFKKQIHE